MVLQEVAPLPGMTTLAEQRYFTKCSELAQDLDGAIVDLGCWMCSTSVSLARGVDMSKHQGGPTVLAFDRFVWEDWMDYYRSHLLCDYRAGESFIAEARRRAGGTENGIELVQADLQTYQWVDGNIRVLLVDAMKTAGIAESIARSFFPHVVPNGIVIQQDFKHAHTPWIHILQYRLRDYFENPEEADPGATVGFTVRRQIPSDAVDLALDLANAPDDEVAAAFDYSLSFVGKNGKSAVAAAHIMHFVHKGDSATARRLHDEYQTIRVDGCPDFDYAAEVATSTAM